MLELMDSGKFAHKYGAKRWVVPAVSALFMWILSISVGNFVDTVGRVAAPAIQSALWWAEPVVFLVAFVLLARACWWAYIDQTRGAYVEAADRYQRDGW